MITSNDVNTMRTTQLARILSNTDTRFYTAFYCIYNDYPTSEFLTWLLDNVRMKDDIRNRIYGERINLDNNDIVKQ